MNTQNLRKLAAGLSLLLFITGCARRDEEPEVAQDEQATVEPVPEPPKEVAAVRVEVELSPKAEAQLKAAGETVHVEVIYGGEPAPNATLQPNDLGMIELGKKTLVLEGSGAVELAESEVDRSRLDQIIGQPQVMVNTTSGRKSTPKNLLACEFYWDTLSVAGKDGVKVPCKLLSEVSGG
jgi:hypothetical protein